MKKFIYLLFVSALVLSCSSDDDGDQQQTATCSRPGSLQASEIGFDRFSLSWTQSSAVSFVIEYGESGFSLGSGTEIIASFESSVITGLEPGTTYNVYVKAICSNNLESEFAGPISVTTRDE